MAIGYDCGLNALGNFVVSATLETIGAEFVDSNFENDPDDGDGCELVIGILLDVLPPFGGQTIPPSTDFLDIGHVDMSISPEAIPGTTLSIEFPDVANGAGTVPIENVVVINFRSIDVLDRTGTVVEVLDTTPFVRGDTNDNGVVDLGDCVTLLSQAFEGAASTCLSAGDLDGDSDQDLDDFFAVADFLFLAGPPIPAPFPECGFDPNGDCDAYLSCP